MSKARKILLENDPSLEVFSKHLRDAKSALNDLSSMVPDSIPKEEQELIDSVTEKINALYKKYK